MDTTAWDERFGWFWFNADEVFHQTQEDLERKAKEFADTGITTVINFSSTHFRLGFAPYWGEINACIGRIVKACHKYGIKVVEHHSAELVHDLNTADGWKRLEEDLGSFTNWTSTVKDWPKIVPFLKEDPTIDGKRMLEWRQIDGRTGEPVVSVYDSHCMCYNNPDYRAVYLRYVEDLIRAGVDGIMNDDVQYFGDGNACTCVHCREKFKQQTGFDLPEPKNWSSFYGDYSNPVFLAWERFRFQSTEDFYRMIYARYAELGFENLYPNYISDLLIHDKTGYPFDRCYDLWSFMFQENCFSAIIRESYMNFAAEAVQRFAQAERRGVPSMSMFYPNRQDSVYFTFALAKAWGQLYTCTPEGADVSSIERHYRRFEKEHNELFTAPKKCRDLSFYLSRDTRDFTENAVERYQKPFVAAMQAALISNLGVDMVFEEDSVETLGQHKCIVAAFCATLSDAQLERLKGYVEGGGKLFILGDFGIYDGLGNQRKVGAAQSMIGANVTLLQAPYTGSVQMKYCGRQDLFAVRSSAYAFEGAEPILLAGDGSVRGIRQTVGAGEIVWLSGEFFAPQHQDSLWAKRRQKVPERVETLPYVLGGLRETAGRLFRLLLHGSITVSRQMMFVNCFAVKGGWAIHLVNLEDTISEGKREVGHEDLIPNFVEGAPKLPEMKVMLALPIAPESATLYTPEHERNIAVPISHKDGKIILSVPKNAFAGYAVIELH